MQSNQYTRPQFNPKGKIRPINGNKLNSHINNVTEDGRKCTLSIIKAFIESGEFMNQVVDHYAVYLEGEKLKQTPFSPQQKVPYNNPKKPKLPSKFKKLIEKVNSNPNTII
jgi:hypothetical protein